MYRKKTKADRKRRKRLLLLVTCIIAVIAGVILFLAIRNMRGSAYRAGDPDDAYAGPSESDDSVITYNGKKYRLNDHLSNYLFIGVDSDISLTSGDAATPGNGGQADAVYLISYDRKEKTVKVFAIPRDTMTQIESFSPDGNSLGYARNHLSLQYAFGDGKQKSCELMETAVSSLFLNLKIDGYTAVNLQSIPHLTQLVGYVDVVVPDDSLADVDPIFQKGATVRLTSENTEEFVRSRDTDESQSALVRMNRQKVFIKAFAQRVKELQSEDASTVTDIYDGLQDYMLTSMSSDIFLNLAEGTQEGDIETIPGKGVQGDVYDEYEVDQDGLYDLIIKNFYVETEE